MFWHFSHVATVFSICLPMPGQKSTSLALSLPLITPRWVECILLSMSLLSDCGIKIFSPFNSMPSASLSSSRYVQNAFNSAGVSEILSGHPVCIVVCKSLIVVSSDVAFLTSSRLASVNVALLSTMCAIQANSSSKVDCEVGQSVMYARDRVSASIISLPGL